MPLRVSDRTPDAFFEAAITQRGIRRTAGNGRICRDVFRWCQENEQRLLNLKDSVGAVADNRDPFVDRAVQIYREEKYGSVLLYIGFQLAYMLIKMIIESYFFSSPAPGCSKCSQLHG